MYCTAWVSDKMFKETTNSLNVKRGKIYIVIISVIKPRSLTNGY
jgi:hypothetical protein